MPEAGVEEQKEPLEAVETPPETDSPAASLRNAEVSAPSERALREVINRINGATQAALTRSFPSPSLSTSSESQQYLTAVDELEGLYDNLSTSERDPTSPRYNPRGVPHPSQELINELDKGGHRCHSYRYASRQAFRC